MFHYLKHSVLTCGIVPGATATVLLAPAQAWLVPPAITLLNALVDTLTPPDRSVPRYAHRWVLEAWIYLYVPLIGLLFFSLMWLAAPGDLLGFSSAVARRLPPDLAAIKREAGWQGLAAATFAVGYVLSSNHLYAHELVHCPSNRFGMAVGRWLLAMGGDAQFSISHVHAHHLHVGTPHDAATARRGESVYRFALRSSIGQYRESWQIESRRLGASMARWLPWRNRVLSGLLMSMAISLAWYAAAGLPGLAIHAVVMVTAKFLFECVNYIEHYGVVRAPGSRVQPRHSWDCDARMSSNALLNLSRHADHHAHAHKRYWELRSHDTGLQLRHGYIGTIVLALAPWLWHRFAAPQLRHWDEHLADADERRLAAEANRASRHPLFTWNPSDPTHA